MYHNNTSTFSELDNDEGEENPISCGYYDIENLKTKLLAQFPRQSALHITIQSLPAKYDQSKVLVDSLESVGLRFGYTMLCENFSDRSKLSSLSHT